MYCGFLGFLKTSNFNVKTTVATSLATIGKLWATFYFNIWSHCVRCQSQVKCCYGASLTAVWPERGATILKIVSPNWAILASLFFVFSIQLTLNVQYKFMPMRGLEPRTCEVGNNRSTNWATTSAYHTLNLSVMAQLGGFFQIQHILFLYGTT